MNDLEAAYRSGRNLSSGPLRPLMSALPASQVVYVGSGGMTAVAHLAANLDLAAGRPAWHITPLRLLDVLPSVNACVVFSARATHPDSALALEFAALRGVPLRALVTNRPAEELAPRTVRYATHVLSLGLPALEDGFLATSSVIGFSAAWAAGAGAALPVALPSLRRTSGSEHALHNRILVLYGPGSGPAATDLETRFAELGLGDVQLADYRNFAHGRHLGLSMHLNSVSLVALIHEQDRRLAEATLRLLPEQLHIVRIESDLEGPAATLDLMAASAQLSLRTAVARGVNPDRPRVPAFGRKLYHLGSGRHLHVGSVGPPDRKLAAAGRLGDRALRTSLESAYPGWLRGLSRQRFVGVALDYDGTVAATEDRFDLPSVEMQREVLKILGGKAPICFVSGRGSSLHRELRSWIPRPLWALVHLGLYNGGLPLRLDEELVPGPDDEGLRELAVRIRAHPHGGVDIERRPRQLTLTRGGSGFTARALAEHALSLAAHWPSLPVKVTQSGHSIDVIPIDSGKAQVVANLEDRFGGVFLAVGDQGQVGGNDFELLAAHEFTLSVDRCSADPTRCWNLGTRVDQSGPHLLLKYLRSLRRDGSFLQFVWSQ